MDSSLLTLGNRAAVTDFGCLHATWVQALPSALAVSALFILLFGVGSLAGGARRWCAADFVSGWGVLTLVLTLQGIYRIGPLSLGLISLLLLFFFALKRHIFGKNHAAISLWFILAIALQLWLLPFLGLAGISGWDDIANWSLNALYMWRHDAFPSVTLAPSYAHWPGYPYAMPFLNFAASLLNNAFIVQGGAMASWLLLVCFAWALVELAHQKTQSFLRDQVEKLALLGLAILLCTLFNPGFNASFTITGQSDTPTAVAIGFLALLFMMFHAALSQTVTPQQQPDKKSNRDAPRKPDSESLGPSTAQRQTYALAVQISLAALTLVMLRQMNVVLLGLLCFGFLLMTLKDGFFLRALALLIPALIPAALLRLAWQHYTQQNLPQGNFSILPLYDWHWELLPELIAAMVVEMVRKWGFFLLMLIASGAGIFGVTKKTSPLRVFSFITAVVFLGYLFFLILAYIGSGFNEREIRNANSFYRYSTHTALLGIGVLWFSLRPLLQKKALRPWLPVIAGVALTFLPLVYISKSSWLVAASRPELCASRQLGVQLTQRLEPQSGLVVLDPDGNGFQTFLINYAFALDDVRHHTGSRVVDSVDEFTTESFATYLPRLPNNPGVTAVYIAPAKANMLDHTIRSFFGLAQEQRQTLMLRNGEAWTPTRFP